MYYCRGMKTPTKKSCIIPCAFSLYLEKWLLQSTEIELVELQAPRIYYPAFWGPDHLIPPQTSSTTSLKPILASLVSKGPMEVATLCSSTEVYQQPFARFRSTVHPCCLVISALFLPARNCKEVSFGWLPPARFLRSQLCADAADSVPPCCEVSSAP